MTFDVQAARQAGYSDADIAGFLAQQGNYDAEGAKRAGYSDQDIISHLTGNQRLGWGPTAVVRGIGDIIGMPRDVPDLVQRGARWAAGFLPESIREPAQRVAQVASLASPLAFPAMVAEHLPTGEQAGNWLLNKTGIMPEEPETRAGRIGAMATRMAAGSAIPGGSIPRTLANIATGAASGALSELAGQATQGTPLEPYARVAAAVAPAVVAHGVGTTRGALPRQAAEAMAGMTPQQVAQAMDLMAEAERLGSPITVSEALQQVGGRNRALSAVQDFAESSAGGGPTMARFMTGREQGAEAAARGAVGNATPPGMNAPMVPAGVQDAANAHIRAATQARSAAVRPLYDAATTAAKQPQAASAVRRVVDSAATDLDTLAQRDQSGLLRPQLERVKSAFDGNYDWESIQDARRYFRDQMRQQAQPGQPVLDRKIGAQALAILDRMTAQLRAAVPALGRADAVYGQISDQVIDPLLRGQVGALADTGNAAAQRGIMFPRNPAGAGIPATPSSTAQATGALLGQNAEATRGLISLELQEALTRATQRGGTGPRQGVGGTFASDVAGNPEQRAILLAAVQRAYGPEAGRGLSRLLDVFEAQQYRPPSNSMTAPRAELRDASQTGGVQALGRVVTRPLTTAGEALERWRAAGSTEDLARMLTTQEGLARLRVLARVGETGLPSIVAGLLNMQRGQVAAQE